MKGRAFCNLISEGMCYRVCCTILYIRYKQLGPVHAQGGGEYKRHTSHIRSKIPKRWMGLPGGSIVKNPPANAGHARDTGLIPGSGRSPGGGNGNPLQYPWLESSTDRRESGRLQFVGLAKPWTWLRDMHAEGWQRVGEANTSRQSYWKPFQNLPITNIDMGVWEINPEEVSCWDMS